MYKFGNFALIKNISKKRVLKELYNIEKKYNLNHEISTYFKDSWVKYLLDKTISYNNTPKNMRTVNSLEIFNRYFHKLCNGKDLVSIYELTCSIKDKFSNSEIKLINGEK